MAPMTPRLKILSGKSPVPSACGFSLLDPYPPPPPQSSATPVPRSGPKEGVGISRAHLFSRPTFSPLPDPSLLSPAHHYIRFYFILFLFLVGERVGDSIACLSASASRHVGRL